MLFVFRSDQHCGKVALNVRAECSTRSEYTYDDRLLVKPVKSAVSLMSNAIYELPYDGAKEMLLVDNVDNKDFLTRLFVAMYDELPAQKKKKS